MTNRFLAWGVAVAVGACARAETKGDSLAARADDGGVPPVVADTSAPPSPSDPSPAPPGEVRRASGREQPRASSTPERRSGADPVDSVRGVVAVTGSERFSEVIVSPAVGRSVRITGDRARTLGAMSGAEVVVRGTRGADGRLTAEAFTVRSVDGHPALDGRLDLTGDTLVLVTGDGARHRIATPPASLRGRVGARVWVTGDLAAGPIAFGVIEEAR